jgi:hypothetical protein
MFARNLRGKGQRLLASFPVLVVLGWQEYLCSRQLAFD